MSAPKAVKTVTFGVTTFAPKTAIVCVCGSLLQLGSWDVSKALVLKSCGSKPQSEYEAGCWIGEVELDVHSSFQYKYIKNNGGEWEWEGPNEPNRTFLFDPVNLEITHYRHPMEIFRETVGSNEMHHTLQFYQQVCLHNDMHFNQVTNDLWVGSCPRQPQHVPQLKKLGITAVLNLQTFPDAIKNYFDQSVDEKDRTAEAVYAMYEKEDMAYVWYPTEDMSSSGRRQMLPQTTLILKRLIEKGHKVYVHCNAGVGRSVSAVCGYLRFVLGNSLRETQYSVCQARPVSYFDEPALALAEKDWTNKYA
eukprot:Platyproteum_vivax@DN12299_c0_g1_i1.p1